MKPPQKPNVMNMDCGKGCEKFGYDYGKKTLQAIANHVGTKEWRQAAYMAMLPCSPR